MSRVTVKCWTQVKWFIKLQWEKTRREVADALSVGKSAEDEPNTIQTDHVTDIHRHHPLQALMYLSELITLMHKCGNPFPTLEDEGSVYDGRGRWYENHGLSEASEEDEQPLTQLVALLG